MRETTRAIKAKTIVALLDDRPIPDGVELFEALEWLAEAHKLPAVHVRDRWDRGHRGNRLVRDPRGGAGGRPKLVMPEPGYVAKMHVNTWFSEFNLGGHPVGDPTSTVEKDEPATVDECEVTGIHELPDFKMTGTD